MWQMNIKHKLKNLKWRYGVDYSVAERVLSGVCEICGRRPEPKSTKIRARRLSIDHDHVTGEFRGILCTTCNTAIGHLNDNPALCDAAAAYLRREVVPGGPTTCR